VLVRDRTVSETIRGTPRGFGAEKQDFAAGAGISTHVTRTAGAPRRSPKPMRTLVALMASLVLVTTTLFAHALVVGESPAPAVAASR